MVMPGRNYSSGGYRFGYQGQEKDDEIKGSWNSINYALRMHDSRLGRFLSIDPLAKHFAGNSPYAFCQNRVIDGIELEGAEYVHYYVFLDANGKTLIQSVMVEDFRGMSDEMLQRTHQMGSSEFYKKYSESFGEKGRGVLYSYFIKDSRDGRFHSGGSSFEESGGTFSHGFYYGAGGPSQQGDRTAVPIGTSGNSFTYDLEPIDEVDALARTHDMTYDQAGATDFYSDPNGLAADIAFVEGLKTFVANASTDGYIDAITGRPPSTESVKSAKIAITSFTILIANKVDNLIKQSNQGEEKK